MTIVQKCFVYQTQAVFMLIEFQGFSSRDFKLENCGLVPGRMAERPLLKLMDFASSKVCRTAFPMRTSCIGSHCAGLGHFTAAAPQDTRDDSPAQTLVGSTPYIAPEMMFPPYDAQARRFFTFHTLPCSQPPSSSYTPTHPLTP